MRTQTAYVAHGVLLRRSVLSSGVVLRRRDSGVGFSVSVVALLILSETQTMCKTLIFPSRSLPVYWSSSFWICPFPPALTERRLCEWTGCTFECNGRPGPNPTYRCFTNSGNFLVIASTVAYTIGLTWGGITAPWGSVTVLVPLVLGLIGLGFFIMYEATLANHPLVCASPCVLIRIVSYPTRSRCRSP